MNHQAFTTETLIAKSLRRVSLSLAIGSLAACGTSSERLLEPDPDIANYSVISSNLLDAVLQQFTVNPLPSTVLVAAPDNEFEQQVYAHMAQEGYVLKTVADDQISSSDVEASVNLEQNSASTVAPLYTLSIGEVSAERRFTMLEGKISPASEMVIRGADDGVVALNDDELFGNVEGSLTSVVFMADDAPSIDEILVPDPVPDESDISTQDKRNQLVRENVFDTMQSNFTSLFQDYDEIERSILVFPDDSMRLGDTNKVVIERYKELMNPQTDILSVIGCSHGTTDIDNGNALLALGRASRVKEAFMFSGVEPEKIFEEGCWAPEHTADNVMPSRGIVLTLKRIKES